MKSRLRFHIYTYVEIEDKGFPTVVENMIISEIIDIKYMVEGPSGDVVSKFVQVRVPISILNEVDKLIEEKKFASRSDFFKRLAIEYFSKGSPEKFKAMLQDPEIRQEIREIVKEKM